MKIDFKNFGAIKQGSLELAPLTLLCGPNNTSKTYALYAIYGILRCDFPMIGKVAQTPQEGTTEINLEEFFIGNIEDLQSRLAFNFSKSLGLFFSTDDEVFVNSHILIQFNLEELLTRLNIGDYSHTFQISESASIIFSWSFQSDQLTIKRVGGIPDFDVDNVFSQILLDLLLRPGPGTQQILFPAERGGLNLFYPELSARRTAIFHHIPKTSDRLRDIPMARYPRPIADYIDFLNSLRWLRREKSEFRDLAVALGKEVLGGSYSIDSDATIAFKPGGVEASLDLHLSSSTAKNLFGLWFYLEHMAQKGDVLMIDEPELNLHPDNQRRIARIFARMVGRGIRIVLSTHSDYLVREFNNLLILGRDFPERDELRAKFRYSEVDRLDCDDVRAYSFGEGTIAEMEMSPDEGIIADTFDRVINELNDSSYELASAWAQFREAREEER